MDHVIPRAHALRAVIFECEKNAPADVVDVFAALNARFPRLPRSGPGTAGA